MQSRTINRLDAAIYVASFPVGLVVAFWLISVHHWFKQPSLLDAGYDWEADAAVFGFIFWFVLSVLGLRIRMWFVSDK